MPGSLNDVRNSELIVNMNKAPPITGMAGEMRSARNGQLERRKKEWGNTCQVEKSMSPWVGKFKIDIFNGFYIIQRFFLERLLFGLDHQCKSNNINFRPLNTIPLEFWQKKIKMAEILGWVKNPFFTSNIQKVKFFKKFFHVL
jgi:hypothetical protein